VSVQPPGRELDAHASRSGRAFGHSLDRWFRRQRCCLCRSPTLRPWIACGAASYVEGCWSPMLDSVTTESARESNTYLHTRIQRQTVEDLSLSGGASSGVGTFQAEHHLLVGSG
jgi:hypothetical protein